MIEQKSHLPHNLACPYVAEFPFVYPRGHEPKNSRFVVL